MPFPQLSDDGSRITLDLHGTPIDEALVLVQRLVKVASQRGRVSIKLIHGTSTSQLHFRNKTIKHALYDLLEEGGLNRYITSAFRAEGYLILSLDITTPSSPDLIRLRDIQ